MSYGKVVGWRKCCDQVYRLVIGSLVGCGLSLLKRKGSQVCLHVLNLLHPDCGWNLGRDFMPVCGGGTVIHS